MVGELLVGLQVARDDDAIGESRRCDFRGTS